MESSGSEKKVVEAISVQDVSSGPEAAIPLQLWKQTRTRRLFSTAQLFAFAIVYFSSWASAMNIYLALQNGGMYAWLFSYILVALGTFFQVASFAEISSIMPVAGAQYYWTYYYAPREMKRFLTWVQGWTTWFGYVAMLIALINNGVIMFEGLISLNYPSYTAGGWRTLLIIWSILFFISIVNMWFFYTVPWFELLAGIISISLFVVIFVALWVLAPRNSLDIFMVKTVTSGWQDNYFVSFNIGSLANIFMFVAFESLIHMGEETRNPKKAVPQSLFWGVVTNEILGLVSIFTYGICMPSVETLLSSVSPFVTIIEYGTKSLTMTTAVFSVFMVLNVANNLGMLSSVSRLTWAWARDGGLPIYFAMVDGKTRVPMRAIVGTSLIGAVLALLNLSGQAYVALGAVTSLTGVAVYTSYAICLSCVIYTRLTTTMALGVWNWGRYGIVFNVLALIYTLYEIVFLPFPNILPVTAANMNYAGPIYGLVLLVVVSWWFLSARHTWKGPNMEVMEIVLRNEETSSRD